MRFSTPISSVPISTKGQIGIRGAVAIGVYSDLFIKKAWLKTDGTVDYQSVVNEIKRQFKYGSAVGFTDFRPFMEGYYDYQEALFKMVIKCSAINQTPEVSRLAVVIDVPDVVEADTCVITSEQASQVYPNTNVNDTTRPMSGEVYIPFKKHFYNVPTITARQLTGATVGTPTIRQGAQDDTETITTAGNKGFWISLKSGTSSIPGSIHWQAIGY